MKEIVTNKGTFLFIEIPQFELPNTLTSKGEIISTTKDITEEQADFIVDKVMNNQHYQNYNWKVFCDRWLKTAKESLKSLMKKNELDVEKNYLIIKTK